MLIHGRCHCGNIGFTLDWHPDPIEIPARACGCTFCRQHAGVWTATPSGTLTVTIVDATLLSKYEFDTRTAQFHVCARCGAVPLVTSCIDERLYAVVNVNVFENVDAALLRAVPASFDGEDVTTRLQRRKANWIGTVSSHCS